MNRSGRSTLDSPSRSAITVAAWLLRSHGSGEVWPLALIGPLFDEKGWRTEINSTVEATWTQTPPDWIASHVRAFQLYGGCVELLIPFENRPWRER